MEAVYIKYLWLVLITLAQIILVGMKIIEKRNHKKSNPGNPGNHGERLATLETKVENIEEDIKEIKEGLEKLRRPGK